MKILLHSLLACLFVTLAKAALPPGAEEELSADASEVLLVQVQNVEVVAKDGSDSCSLDYDVGVTVLSVNSTTTGLTSGRMVELKSYSIDRTTDGCQGWVGPTPPPVLEAGWCGYVYLVPGMEEGVMDLAAYGASLVPAIDSEECQDVTVVDTDTAEANAASETGTQEAGSPGSQKESESDSSGSNGSTMIVAGAAVAVGFLFNS